jgi:hypothetical protein
MIKNKTSNSPDRTKGRQMGIIPPKKGKLNDSTFGPFITTATVFFNLYFSIIIYI